MPMYPLLSMRKLVADDDPITNWGLESKDAVGLMEKSPQGVVVPMPTYPDVC